MLANPYYRTRKGRRSGRRVYHARVMPGFGYNPHRRHHRRRRNPAFFPNPFLTNPGKGTNWLLIGGVAVGAYFLLRGGALGSIFGSAAPPGYTQLGTSGYYRGPDGQLYQRTATGGMMVSPTQVASGSAAEQQLISAAVTSGIRYGIPVLGQGIAAIPDFFRNLFGGGSATGNIPATDGTTGSTADVLGTYGGSALPPLPDIGSVSLSDWWNAPDTSAWFSQPAAPEPDFSLWGTPGVMDMSLSLAPLPPLPDYGDASFFGLRGFGHLALVPSRGGYGLARRGPSGEVEARFLRQPPSYR